MAKILFFVVNGFSAKVQERGLGGRSYSFQGVSSFAARDFEELRPRQHINLMSPGAIFDLQAPVEQASVVFTTGEKFVPRDDEPKKVRHRRTELIPCFMRAMSC